LTLRQWVASLNGVAEIGYFATDDLRPFIECVVDRIPLPLVPRVTTDRM
jgi:hypothetical protein